MRGRQTGSRLAEFKTPRQNTAPAIPKTIPAPIGGWNTRDSLAGMKPIYAVMMDNFYPESSYISLRPGRLSWATGASGGIKTLVTYQGGAVAQMFATTSTGFYDVTNSGAVGAAVTTCTSPYWEFRNFSTSGGKFLTMVNSVDSYKIYDGTTWYAVTGVSTPFAVTGVATTDLTNIHAFKRRLWFTVKNSLSVWYLPINSVAGALTEFPLGPIFSEGGYVVAQFSWTFDGGDGPDDYLVTVTSEGEMALYSGTDPGTDFALVGVYSVGRPIGKRCFIKYGGDVLYLSKRGIFVLSKLLLSVTIDRSIALSDLIDEAFRQYVIADASVFGWQTIIHPTKNALIVNVPFVEGSTSIQLVMNNISKAWCRFIGWSMDCMIDFGDELYGASGNTVYQLWEGLDDSGTPIQATCQQAYVSLGRQCQVSMTKPSMAYLGNLTILTSIDTDFQQFQGVEASSQTYLNLSSLWDSGLWDSAIWSASPAQINNNWLTNNNQPGMYHSFQIQVVTSTATLTWTSTDFAVLPTGML